MSHHDHHDEGNGVSRRKVLECMTWAGTGVLWTISGGVPRSLGLVDAANAAEAIGMTFMQISDSHSASTSRPIRTRLARWKRRSTRSTRRQRSHRS